MESLVAAFKAAKLGSFSAAALDLEITHAAVSRRIAAAEAWAGVRLFDRHGRGVVVTPDGQRILARAALAVGQIADLADRPRRQKRVPVVRMAVTPSFARFWLLPRILDLEGHPSSLRIEVVAELRHADIAARKVDLAIRYGRGGWRVATEHRLLEEMLQPVVAPGLASPRAHQRAADIIALPLLHDGDSGNWKAWAAFYKTPYVPKPADRTFADYALTLAAASAGLGVALWNRGLHSLSESNGALAPLGVFQAPSPLGYYLLSRPGEENTPTARVAEGIRAACRLRKS
jgi:LysR family glycine cleavage system transcriptional activator